jgi:predicted transcriptional regulator
MSVRFPPALYEEVTAYAKRLGADRTYVVVECVRQTLDADRAWKREWRKLGGG